MSASIGSSRLRGPFVLALALVALNMRVVFTSLPPLLGQVRDELGLSAAVAGLLTAGPILCFGLLAPVVPRLVARTAVERLVGWCAALTAAGAALRGMGGTAGLFAGTLLAGAAVAVGQGVVPVLLRARFAGRLGLLTGIFTAGLTVGATLAAATSVPLADALGSWQAALAAYGLVGAAAAVTWSLARGASTIVPRGAPVGLLRSTRAWSVAVYFGLQSMAFYCGLTWLPSILRDDGYGEAAAGALQALGNAVQFLPALAVPVLAGRRDSQTAILVVLVATAVVGLVGLLAAPGAAAAWMCLVGVAQGGCFGLGLVLPVLRGRGPYAVASLTAMTLSVGYLIASLGPSLLGLAHDVSGRWSLVLVLLVVITLAELPPGVLATRRWKIGLEDG